MTEKQAERMIELLESINEQLNGIKSDTGWIQLHTSNIESNTSE